jgi:hypothetical protein
LAVEVVAVAVAVTFCEPSLRIVGLLSVKTRFAAFAQSPEEHVPSSSPKGGVPASPPPQPAMNRCHLAPQSSVELFIETSRPV